MTQASKQAREATNRMRDIMAGPHARMLLGNVVVVEPLQFVKPPAALDKCVCCRRWPDMVPNCGFRGCPHK